MADLWYYTCEGKQMDPVTTTEIRRLARDGVLKPTDMVWKEGMPRWVRASSAKEIFPDPTAALDNLFPPGPAGPPAVVLPAAAPPAAPDPKKAPARAAPAPAPKPPAPAPKAAAPPPEKEPAPRPRRRKDERDEDEDDRPRRRPAPRPQGSAGLIVALCVGGGVIVVVFIVGVLAVLFTRSGPRPGPPPLVNNQPPPGFNPPANNQPPAGGPGVNLAIIGQVGQVFLNDTQVRPDIPLDWTAPQTGFFDLLLKNQSPNPVRATVTVREPNNPGKAPTPPYTADLAPRQEDRRRFQFTQGTRYQLAVKVDDKNPGGPAADLPPDVRRVPTSERIEALRPGQEHVFKVQIPAGKKAAVRLVGSTKLTAGVTIQAFRDATGAPVVADPGAPGPGRQVTFTAPETEAYRIRVHNAGTATVRCTVLVTAS